MIERRISQPEVNVAEAEFRRLLGYPRGHEPGARANELAAWARDWFARHGQPWIYLREVALQLDSSRLLLDGVEFRPPTLHDYFHALDTKRAVLLAVSAGPDCEDEARKLWGESKPDEYFFLEMFGSAVVEHLVAAANGLICAEAEQQGFSAIPHYSPGYGGWDVADQNALFELIRGTRESPFPGPLEVMPSGMLRPKKSLLGVIGLGARSESRRVSAVPCERCAFSPCQYRRAPYRHAGKGSAEPARPMASAPASSYTVNVRALQKWSRERVGLRPLPGGATDASFRFDGTTCSNLGVPLAFEYRLEVGPAPDFAIRRAECHPVAGDSGYRSMCAYLRDPEELMTAIGTEVPPLGQSLADALRWPTAAAPSGCTCDAPGRAHKWRLALEAIHYALASSSPSTSPRTALSSVP